MKGAKRIKKSWERGCLCLSGREGLHPVRTSSLTRFLGGQGFGNLLEKIASPLGLSFLTSEKKGL